MDETRLVQVVVTLDDDMLGFSLDRAEVVDLPAEQLDQEPVEEVGFGPLPGDASKPKSYDRWGKELVRWIQGEMPLTLFESRAHKLISRPGESEREFRMRLADLGREARDAEADKLRQKYQPKFTTLQERIRRAEQAVEKKQGQSQQAMLGAAVAVGGSILGALLGGRRGRGTTSAIRGAGRAAQSRQGIEHATETVEAARAQLTELEQAFADELRRIEAAPAGEAPLEEVVIRPALNAIALRLVTLAWLPCGSDAAGRPVAAWRR